jgi:hypothetical protein
MRDYGRACGCALAWMKDAARRRQGDHSHFSYVGCDCCGFPAGRPGGHEGAFLLS